MREQQRACMLPVGLFLACPLIPRQLSVLLASEAARQRRALWSHNACIAPERWRAAWTAARARTDGCSGRTTLSHVLRGRRRWAPSVGWRGRL